MGQEELKPDTRNEAFRLIRASHPAAGLSRPPHDSLRSLFPEAFFGGIDDLVFFSKGHNIQKNWFQVLKK